MVPFLAGGSVILVSAAWTLTGKQRKRDQPIMIRYTNIATIALLVTALALIVAYAVSHRA